MRHFLLLLLVAGAFAFAACGHDDNHPANDHAHGDAAGAALKLNDGKKWQADQHTNEAMAGISKSLAEQPSASTEELNALGNDLKTRVDALVQGCTMTGPEHQQLHVFLEEFIPAVEHLAQETDAAKAKEAHQQVSHLAEEYGKYFQ
jgi:hypothetical protein